MELQFEEENYAPRDRFQPRPALGEDKKPELVKMLLRMGVKDERTAYGILWAVIVVSFAVSASLLVWPSIKQSHLVYSPKIPPQFFNENNQ